VATQSGHVFVRSRNAKSLGQSGGAKTFKFRPVPYLQRVVSVCANNTGAFGALRVDYPPTRIRVPRKQASEHLAAIQPYLRFPASANGLRNSQLKSRLESFGLTSNLSSPSKDGDEEEDSSIQKDIDNLQQLCFLLNLDKRSRKGPQGRLLFDGVHLTHGADLMVQSPPDSEFPAHRVWLAARSPVLCEVLSGSKTVKDKESKISIRLAHVNKHPTSTSSLPRLIFSGCNSLSILLLLTYLYSDELLSVWDQRIAVALGYQLQDLKIQVNLVKLELQALARILDLPHLVEATHSSGKCIPASSLALDLCRLVQATEEYGITQIKTRGPRSPMCPDVVIQLRDKEVLCHSVVLRARSSLFAAFFDDEDWTSNRWDEYGIIKVDMKQWDWRVMQFPLRFLCSGFESSDELFGALGKLTRFTDEKNFDCYNQISLTLLMKLLSLCLKSSPPR
jgi:inhibitor of Bruton tyrosine kinase